MDELYYIYFQILYKYLSKYVERGFYKFDPAISTIPDSKPYRLEYKICKEYKISFESSLGNARKI